MEEFIEILNGWFAYALTSTSLEMAGNLLSLVLIVVIISTVIRWHFAEASPVNLADLFLDESGKIGGSKMRMNGIWLLCCWAMIYLTLNKNLTEWYVAAVLTAFVADRKFARDSQPTSILQPETKE